MSLEQRIHENTNAMIALIDALNRINLTTPTAKLVTEPEPEPEPEQASSPLEETDLPKITIDDVSASMLQGSRMGLKKQLLEILANYGVQTLPQAKESDLPAIFAEVETLLNAAEQVAA